MVEEEVYEFEEIEKQSELSLTPNEIERVDKVLSMFDKDNNGYVHTSDLKSILEMLDQSPTEDDLIRLTAEFLPAGETKISKEILRDIVQEQKKKGAKAEDDDMLQAFTAMGGGANGTGSISAQKLKQIVKDQFEMTIDIEKLIKEIDKDGSGTIEFDEFKSLLTSNI